MADIQIDSSQLTFPLLAIPKAGDGFVNGSGAEYPTVSLPEGSGYHLRQGTHAITDFCFDVKADGTVDFDEACDGFLSGRGEHRLTVRGLPIRLDATALSHAVVPQMPGASPLAPDRSHHLSLLPSSHYRLDVAVRGVTGHIDFAVALDGSVQLDPAFARVARASGNTLILAGQAIDIDGRALSHDLLPIGFAGPATFLSRATVNQLTLLPGTGYGFQPGSGIIADLTYGIDTDGQVILDPQYADFASASGTTLTIRGQAINIDGRALSHDLLPTGIAADIGFLSRASVHQVTMIPAAGYGFQPGSGIVADLSYRVGRDGRISLGSDFSAFASADGNTLTIRGHAINIDGRELSHDLMPIGIASDTGFLPRAQVNQLTIIPGAGYGFQPGSGIVADLFYRIERDGHISLGPEFAPFATADGNTLTIRGHAINIDGRALSHDLLPIGIASDTGFLPRAQVNQLTIIPGAGYGFQPGSGIVADLFYRIERDGRISLASEAAAFASASGSTLTIRGHVIKIDGRTLSHDLLPTGIADDGMFLSRATVNERTIIPASGYSFQPGSGQIADFHYRVRPDGTVDFPASCDAFLVGRGTSTLIVRGYPMVLSAVDADSDLVGIANLALPAQTPRELVAVLVPAKTYIPQSVNGVFRTPFNVERDGRITFDPAAAGSYVVRNSSAPNPSRIGEDVTISVQVQRVPSAVEQPMGSVTFKVGATVLGAAMLSGSGEATFTTSRIPQGEHDIVIDYPGNQDFEPSSTRVRHRAV